MSREDLVENHSSESISTTRVKLFHKQPRKTVGITIPKHLIEEAEK